MVLHVSRLQLFCLLVAAAAPATAQDEATTLSALMARADAVAVARVVRVDLAQPGTRQATLLVETVLAGNPPATITLAEPEQRGCGRALQALVPGQRLLACLRADAGEWVLCARSGRALPLATTNVVAHVRALAAAVTGSDRLAVLIDALRAEDPRVRDDAALTLAYDPALLAADERQRAAVVTALGMALATQTRGLVSLVTTSARLRAEAALDVLLPCYLDGNAGPCERLLASGMLQIGQEALANRLAARLPSMNSPLARARALSLLYDMDTAAARPPLLLLARSAPERGTRARACAALLRAGMPESELSGAADAELLQLAREVARPKRPHFRAIRPE